MRKSEGIYMNFIEAVNSGKPFRSITNVNFLFKLNKNRNGLDMLVESAPNPEWKPSTVDLDIQVNSTYVSVDSAKSITAENLRHAYFSQIPKSGVEAGQEHFRSLVKALGLQ